MKTNNSNKTCVKNYLPPIVEIIEIEVEKGFAVSNNTEFIDTEKGEWD